MELKKTGAFIAQCRREAGLTQKELAERLHVSDRAVSKWERGLNLPGADLFEPLCQILGVTVRELLRGERCEDDEILPEEIAQAMYRLEAMEKEEKRRKKRNRVLAALLLLAAILTAAFLVGRVWYRDWQAQQRADDPKVWPGVTFTYWAEIGNIEIDALILGGYGPHFGQGEDMSLAAIPAVQRPPGGITDRVYIKVLDLEGGSPILRGYIYGAKTGMTIQVLRWPQELRGTDADFSDGQPVEFFPNDDGAAYRGADSGVIFDVEPGYLYSLILGWGEGYYGEYAFATAAEEQDRD